MKLFWTEPAIQDLRDLRDYIAADSDFHAADVIATIIASGTTADFSHDWPHRT